MTRPAFYYWLNACGWRSHSYRTKAQAMRAALRYARQHCWPTTVCAAGGEVVAVVKPPNTDWDEATAALVAHHEEVLREEATP